MNVWISWAGGEAPELCLSMLERYADSLPSDGRKASTRHRKVLAVEAMWVWARKRPDLFPGVPAPMAITGDDAESVKPPPPVVRPEPARQGPLRSADISARSPRMNLIGREAGLS
jgi:hypothetical protein